MTDLFTPPLKVGEGNALFLFDIQTMSKEAVRAKKDRGEYGKMNDKLARMWWGFTRGK